MNEHEAQTQRVWSFPERMLGPDDSIKGFRVEASDGHVGKVAWASYAPGESYLVIRLLRHLHEVHHVVPAAAVERVGTDERKVWLRLTRAEIEQAPEHHDPAAPPDSSMIDAWSSATSTLGFGGDMM
jgi:hypothetical protein